MSSNLHEILTPRKDESRYANFHSKPVWVVIPAAGVGTRMQMDCPKQYLQLEGKTVLEHTLDCFLGCAYLSGIVVVVSAEDSWWPQVAQRLSGLPVYATAGGKERADSVLNGLNYLAEKLGDAADVVVMVHDAARPCLSRRDLHLLLAAADSDADNGALLATPVRDTMKRAQPDSHVARVAYTEAREGLWHALTPQMATLPVLRHALTQALAQGATVTDEASALEFISLRPRLLEGEASNLKITRPADLALAAWLLQQRIREEEE